jgi:hypothetical protein
VQDDRSAVDPWWFIGIPRYTVVRGRGLVLQATNGHQAREEHGRDVRERRLVRSAQAQALIREVNEQIHLFARQSDAAGDLCRIVCECAGSDCLASLEIPLERYEAVRQFPTRFVVAPNHDTADAERVVEDAAGYLVVEKVGAGAVTAVRLDPRRHSRRP